MKTCVAEAWRNSLEIADESVDVHKHIEMSRDEMRYDTIPYDTIRYHTIPYIHTYMCVCVCANAVSLGTTLAAACSCMFSFESHCAEYIMYISHIIV